MKNKYVGSAAFQTNIETKKFLKSARRSLLKNQNNYPYLFVANIMDPVTITMIALNVYVMILMYSYIIEYISIISSIG